MSALKTVGITAMEIFLWLFSAFNFWLLAQNVMVFIPVDRLWMPPGTTTLFGVAMGLVGFTSLKNFSEDKNEAWRRTKIYMSIGGVCLGAWIGWSYALRGVGSGPFGWSPPPSSSERLLPAIVSGILGFGANFGTAWTKQKLEKRPLWLVIILVSAIVVQFVAMTGILLVMERLKK